MQNAQKLSGVFPAIDIEDLNDFLFDFRDVEVCGTRFKPPLGCRNLKVLSTRSTIRENSVDDIHTSKFFSFGHTSRVQILFAIKYLLLHMGWCM